MAVWLTLAVTLSIGATPASPASGPSLTQTLAADTPRNENPWLMGDPFELRRQMGVIDMQQAHLSLKLDTSVIVLAAIGLPGGSLLSLLSAAGFASSGGDLASFMTSTVVLSIGLAIIAVALINVVSGLNALEARQREYAELQARRDQLSQALRARTTPPLMPTTSTSAATVLQF